VPVVYIEELDQYQEYFKLVEFYSR
jgi:hypothetical protein